MYFQKLENPHAVYALQIKMGTAWHLHLSVLKLLSNPNTHCQIKCRNNRESIEIQIKLSLKQEQKELTVNRGERCFYKQGRKGLLQRGEGEASTNRGGRLLQTGEGGASTNREGTGFYKQEKNKLKYYVDN